VAENEGSVQNQPEAGNLEQKGTPFTIPDAYKGEKSLQSYKTQEDFVKSHVELNKKLGSAVWLPGEKDDPTSKAEKMGRIYNALGKPESSDKYSFGSLLPEGADNPLNEQQLLGLQNFAHANNFNQSQFEAAAKFVLDLHTDGADSLRTQVKADEESMLKEWGPHVFKQRSNLARAAILKLGGEKLAQTFADRGLGSNPEQLMEDNALTNGDIGGSVSKQEALKKIAEMQANPNDLYHRKHATKAGHKERVEEVQSWFQIAYS
jgi:hypothetical protein